MKTAVLDIQPFPQSDAARADSVFAGHLVVYRQVAAMADLLGYARERLTAAFAPHDPPTAHAALPPDDYRNRIDELRHDWRRDRTVKQLWTALFGEVGCDLDKSFYDWFAIRVVPPATDAVSREGLLLPPHRDTWGSNVYQQINWWAPVFPLESDRTIVVFPGYWARPVANNSATWDLLALRALPPAERKAYPNLARVEAETLDDAPAAIIIDPGDVLCFSAQHLHASGANTTGLARLNVEARTVNLDDVRTSRAAPNIDGAAPQVAWDWFKRITDGRNLSDCLT